MNIATRLPRRPHFDFTLRRLAFPRMRLLLKIVMWIIAILAFCAGLLQTNLFRLDRVDVTGTTQLSRDDILSIAKIHAGGSISRVNTDTAESRLEAHPWILHARVEAHWPHVVNIAIVEQRAVAVASTADKKFAQLGPDGTVLSVDAKPKAGLPVTLNVNAPATVGAKVDGSSAGLLQVATLMPASLQPRVVQMQEQNGSFKLGLQGGTIVNLGDSSDLSDKLLSAASVVSHADPKTMAELDVTSPRFPVSRPKTPTPAATSTATTTPSKTTATGVKPKSSAPQTATKKPTATTTTTVR